MSTYFISDNPEGHEQELSTAVKIAVCRQFPQAIEDPVFSLAYDQEGQIFLKGTLSIFWGRVFKHKLSSADVQRVDEEIERLSKNFSQGIQPCLFFPQTDRVIIEALSHLRPQPVMFEYYFLESEAGKSWGIKPVRQEASEKMNPGVYSFYRNSRLTRDELAELIDLSCNLRKFDTSPALTR